MSPRSKTAEEDDHSDQEPFGDEEAGQESGVAGGSTAKRTPRACDRCRRSKSRCIASTSGDKRCKACVAAGAECAFSGPTFRRGPPKGYIQALEARLHQMESVLAAIMSSKDARATEIISDLRRDRLAKHILDGVDAGPFGPGGRKQRSIDPTQDNFFASIVSPAQRQQSDRSRRQSRSTRESVIQAKDDPAASERPTLEWQDRLSESLARWAQSRQPPAPEPNSSTRSRIVHFAASKLESSRDTEEPARTKRKVTAHTSDSHVSWDDVHGTADTDEDELDDWADAFGHLSLDEHREVRYHGKLSGIHLLAQHQRDDRRNFGGVWRFPMAKLWPRAPSGDTELGQRERKRMEAEASIALPPANVQAHLIALYFTYVNTALPVLDEAAFMEQYNAEYNPSLDASSHAAVLNPTADTVQPERMQKMSKLLLLAVFAFAAQYWDPEQADQYAQNARLLLDTVYHESRTSTVQALVLMGVRAFGIASVEEGWLHVGMAVRMAFDLGLNRNSESWLNHGRPMFSPVEQGIRKRIWWACCLADRYASHHLGRPMMIHESDSSTLLPIASEEDDNAPWVPLDPNAQGQAVLPMPGMRQSYHRAIASLSLIHGQIVDQMYPVTRVDQTPRRALMEQIHSRLIQWSLELPETLQYSSRSKRPCPPPHVLVLHIQFWAMMLLLHRPFIPKCLRSKVPPSPGSADDHIPWKSFDFCQSAAAHVSAFATLYHQNFDIRWATPLISSSLQSAGIMHIVALRLRSDDARAATGLTQCINVCERMRDVWLTTARVADLLRGAGVQIAVSLTNPDSPLRKRPAEIALRFKVQHPGQPTSTAEVEEPPQRYPESSVRPMPAAVPLPQPQPHQDPQYGPNLVTALLGPTYAPTACVAPGFDWWPIVSTTDPAAQPQQQQQQYAAAMHPLTMPSQSFTFTQEHFSHDFLQGIRDPILHFPTPPAYPPPGH